MQKESVIYIFADYERWYVQPVKEVRMQQKPMEASHEAASTKTAIKRLIKRVKKVDRFSFELITKIMKKSTPMKWEYHKVNRGGA